jgi:hypothetical protein
MAITVDVLTIRQNHRGMYFEFIGDGATTVVKVAHSRFVRPGMTCTAQVVTAPTTQDSGNSNWGGHNVPKGTPATVSSAVVNSDGTVSVTLSAAVTNATRAYCNVLHALQTD